MIDHYDGSEPLHEYLTRLFSTEGIADQPNQLHPRYVGGGGNLNPWAGNDSSSRSQMYGSHLSQALVIDKPSVRRTLTGIEHEYGNYTFKLTMPETGRIIKILDKSVMRGKNPQRLAIYEQQQRDAEGRAVFDIVEVNRVSSRHQYFGFTYKPTVHMSKFVDGATITKGTVLSQSPSLDEHGNHRMGVSSKIAFLSTHGTIEDGAIVRRKWLERFKATGIESRAAKWGDGVVPLNVSGDEYEYRTHPDIGQKVADHGILMGTRDYDPYLAIVNMSNRALRIPDLHFDNLIRAEGAEVIDVTVLHDYNVDKKRNRKRTPVTISAKDRRYYNMLSSQHTGLLDTYKRLQQEYGQNMVISPELQRRLVWAYGFTNGANRSETIDLTNRGTPIGDYYVEVQYRYDILPSVGSKITNSHGNKCIIVGIQDDEDMPQWDDGTIADVIMDADSVNKRMNVGGLYEVATNAVGEQVRLIITKLYQEGQREEAYRQLMEYYSIVSPLFHRAVCAYHFGHPKPGMPDLRMSHVEDVIKDGVYLIIPPHTPNIGSEAMRQLEERYGIIHKPARIPDGKGGFKYTKDDVLIGETYITMLEKNGFDWSAVSSAVRNHYGIIGKRSQADKHFRPNHDNAVRITAEAEIRLFLVLLPDHIVADILDRANNPHAHKAEVESILKAENVAQIETAVDRNVLPLGGNRAINYIRHIMHCAGIEITSYGRK